ncbi:DUF2752 domain-containing protein [Prevotella sp. E2-28]|uniref:DUF2752 domain-containing protein n=1 Tax=Prevotella sp. E2-28 TaxID=2913620 RepID=UPI001EDC82C7|nr:DUF2752 domain-containing protein [Prevotella sp. E2-28]UKK54488.1 DUF2752 domain-containing protein [Prevotella sp. E2-28]
MKKSFLILGIIGIVIVLALLYFFNPVETAFAPKCIFHELTGLSCSGCGMQRFLHAFLHGRFIEAFRFNYILIIFLPYILLFGIERLALTGDTQKKWRSVLEGRAVTISLCIIAPTWVIVRNVLHI